jgi:hypothetical protein
MSAQANAMRPETKGFLIHLAAFVAVNAVLIVINLTRDPSNLWFVWPLFGWGIGIGAHWLALFLHSHEAQGGIYADHAVRGFIIHAYVYVGVNILLFILNITDTPHQLWFIWPLLGWGIGVAVHGFLVFRGHHRREEAAAKAAAAKAPAAKAPAAANAPKTKRAPAKRAAAKRTAKPSTAKRKTTGRKPKTT